MRKFLLVLFFSTTLFISNKINGQTCVLPDAGPNINLPCGTACTPFTAKVPDIRTTEDYSVNSIPYNPYPFVTAAPALTLACNNLDDKHFDTSFLPFKFCFYSNTYTKFAISSNDLITFDVSNVLKTSTYGFTNTSILNYTGTGTQTQITPPGTCPGGSANPLFPRACIMACFQDINIDFTSTNKKMEYRVEGTAPCRRAIISFNEIPHFSCTTELQTTEIVLYESTNIVEIFIKKKARCDGYQLGYAIVGMQNWERDKKSVPPGRNGGQWSAIDEAWQFKPTGANSLLDHAELLLNGVVVATGTIGALNNGYYDVDFGNVCPPNQNNTYTVRGVYKTCNNDPTFFNLDDDVEINRIIPFYTNGTITKSILCNGDATAEVTFNPIGNTNPYTYSKNGGVTYQVSNIFSNLSAGPNTFRVKDVNDCIKDTVINIPEPTALTLSFTKTQTNCSNKTGTITLTAGGGTPGYQYSINNGATYQTANIFNNLAVGTYNGLQIKDANGCIKKLVPAVGITLLDTMRLELGPDSTICVGQTVLLQPQTNTETDTFKWTPPPPLLDYDTAKNPIAKPLDTTKYTLIAKWGVCNRTDNITINVKHKPVPEAGADTTICDKIFAYLKGSASNLSGTVNYAWAPANLVTPPNVANTICYPDTTRYFYLTVTDNYGCNFSVVDSVKITMRPPVNAFAGNDTIGMYNKPHQLEATGGLTYLWSPAAPLNNPFARRPIAILNHDQYFTVTVTDEIGCSANDGVFVKVYEGPTYNVPNAFSPNGDGLNEVFRPIPSGIQSTDYFRVYDRYGTLLFQTRQWLKGWDGTFQGKPALAGTYTWMVKGIDVNGQVVEQTGTVILIR